MCVITLIFATNALLFLPLVAAPYLARQIGADPRSQPPYEWQGLGLTIYENTLNIYLATACFAVPLIIVQTIILLHAEDYLSTIEKAFHRFFLALSCVMSIFAVTVMSGFWYWWID
jgi:hypothetical protein